MAISRFTITVKAKSSSNPPNYIPEFGLQQLWWIFNTIAACIFVPTILSLYKKNLNEKGVFWGILIAFIIGIPLFIYSNIIGDANWIVGTSLFIVVISSIFSLAPKNS